MLLTNAEVYNFQGARGEPCKVPLGVVDPMHADTFNVRNLGDPILANKFGVIRQSRKEESNDK